MEIDYMNEFITLAEIGNYMETADTLYLAQSTLSRHIQSIEKDLGVPLFNRTTRKVELNNFGRLFLPYAKQIQLLKDAYTKALAEELRSQTNHITIGTIPSMTQYDISSVLARFHEEFPAYNLDIISADSTILEKLLLDGSCDFAFVRTGQNPDAKFQRLHYFTDSMVAVIPRNHPLASSESIALTQLKDESFLLLSDTSSLLLSDTSTIRSFAVSVCRDAGFEPHVGFIGNRTENIIDLVKRGMGIGLMAKRPLSHVETTDVAILNVLPQLTSCISLAFLSEQALSPSAKKFLKFYQTLELQ